jgi:uncharacterized membrane protein YozB (DUF420 family)
MALMSYLISPQANLVLQIIIFAILFVSFVLKMKHKYFLHGATMLTAVILNALSFLLVMGPRLSDLRQNVIVNYTFSRLSLTTIAHAALGSIAEILAILIVATWHLQSGTKNCIKKKKVMRVTFLLWFVALALGFVLYSLLNL